MIESRRSRRILKRLVWLAELDTPYSLHGTGGKWTDLEIRPTGKLLVARGGQSPA
jgi:hypothetical protein